MYNYFAVFITSVLPTLLKLCHQFFQVAVFHQLMKVGKTVTSFFKVGFPFIFHKLRRHISHSFVKGVFLDFFHPFFPQIYGEEIEYAEDIFSAPPGVTRRVSKKGHKSGDSSSTSPERNRKDDITVSSCLLHVQCCQL